MNVPVLAFDYHQSNNGLLWYWTMFIDEDPVARSTDLLFDEESCKDQILAVAQLIRIQDPITVTNRDTEDEYEIRQ